MYSRFARQCHSTETTLCRRKRKSRETLLTGRLDQNTRTAARRKPHPQHLRKSKRYRRFGRCLSCGGCRKKTGNTTGGQNEPRTMLRQYPPRIMLSHVRVEREIDILQLRRNAWSPSDQPREKYCAPKTKQKTRTKRESTPVELVDGVGDTSRKPVLGMALPLDHVQPPRPLPSSERGSWNKWRADRIRNRVVRREESLPPSDSLLHLGESLTLLKVRGIAPGLK